MPLNFNELNQLADDAATNLMNRMNTQVAQTENLRRAMEERGFAFDTGERAAAVSGEAMGVTVGGLIANAIPGARLARVLVGVGCRAVGGILGHVGGTRAWRSLDELVQDQQYQNALADLRTNYNEVREQQLNRLLQDRDAGSQAYLRQRLNQRIRQQAYFRILTDQQKQQVENELNHFQTGMQNFSQSDQQVIGRLNTLCALQGNHFWQLSDVFHQQNRVIPESDLRQITENNQSLFNTWQANVNELEPHAQQQLHGALNAQQEFAQEVEQVVNEAAPEARPFLNQQAILMHCFAAEAVFGLFSTIGAMTHSRALQSVGRIGQASAAIAINAAMLAGKIATPGIVMTQGIGMLIPYAGIVTAGLMIVDTLFNRDNNQEDGLNEALQFISQQLVDLRQLVSGLYERFDRLEIIVENVYVNLRDLLQTLGDVLTDRARNSQIDNRNRLNQIRVALNQLSEFIQVGLQANYLQEFTSTCDRLEDYCRMQGDRQNQIEDYLVKLTTWLKEENHQRNANGSWHIPANISPEAWWNSENLQRHQQVLTSLPQATAASQLLGYLGKLVSSLPNVNLNEINLSLLPNIPLFLAGVESYVKGRRVLGCVRANMMDPQNYSLGKIRKVAANGLQFFDRLSAQKQLIITGLLTKYREVMTTLFSQMKNVSKERLKTNQVSGLEGNVLEKLTPLILLPANFPGTATINTKEGPKIIQLYPLSSPKVANDLYQQASVCLPRLVYNALRLGIGEIRLSYVGSDTPAERKINEYGHRTAGHYWIYRKADYAVSVSYFFGNQSYSLFTLTYSWNPGQSSENVITVKDHNPTAASYDELAAKANAVPLEQFLLSYWDSASFTGIASNTALNLPENLKNEIINQLVEISFEETATMPDDRYNLSHDCNQKLMAALNSHRELLNNIPDQLTSLRNLLFVCADLCGIPTTWLQQLRNLWSGEQIYTKLQEYISASNNTNARVTFQRINHALVTILNAAFNAINQETDNNTNTWNPIYQQLRHASQALGLLHWSEQAYHQAQQLLSIGQVIIANEQDEQERIASGIDANLYIIPRNIKLNLKPEFLLGRGSFGEVYKGTDRRTNTNIAIKLLYSGANLTTASHGELQLLRRQLWRDASAIGLVKILGLSRFNERYGIVMEYVENGTLYHHLHEKREQALPWNHRYQIMEDVAKGILYLHAHGIVHADIKSGNVLLTANWHAKLTDFGLARIVADTQRSTTNRAQVSNNTAAGTLPWRAPEFFTNPQTRPSTQTDIWSLGMVLWEVITRKYPFENTDGSDNAIVTYWLGLNVLRQNNLPAPEDLHPIPSLNANAETTENREINAVLEIVNPIISECRSLVVTQRPTAERIVNVFQQGRQNPHINRFFQPARGDNNHIEADNNHMEIQNGQQPTQVNQRLEL